MFFQDLNFMHSLKEKLISCPHWQKLIFIHSNCQFSLWCCENIVFVLSYSSEVILVTPIWSLSQIVATTARLNTYKSIKRRIGKIFSSCQILGASTSCFVHFEDRFYFAEHWWGNCTSYCGDIGFHPFVFHLQKINIHAQDGTSLNLDYFSPLHSICVVLECPQHYFLVT